MSQSVRLTLLLILCAPYLYAQNGYGSLKDLLDMEVVSTSKTKIRLNEAPGNVTIITAEDIELAGYRTLEDVMKDLPGFDFSTGQPAGEYPTHFHFRGLGDVGQSQFLILVNGIPQNDISNGWARNVGYNFLLADVESIEFVSGPGTSLYGLNAYSGYINVRTKTHSSDSIQAAVRVMGGSDVTIAPAFELSAPINDRISMSLAGRYYYSNGDWGVGRPDPGNYFSNNFEPDSVLTIGGTVIANETDANGKTKPLAPGFNNRISNYYLRGNFRSEAFSFDFNFWNRKEGLGSEVPGYEYFANDEGLDYLAHHQGRTLSLSNSYSFTDKVHSKTKLYVVNTSVLPSTGFTYTYQFQSVNNGTDPLQYDYKKTFKSDGFLFGFDQQLHFDLKNHNVLFSFQGEQRVREYFNINYVSDSVVLISQDLSPGETIQTQNVFFSRNGAIILQDRWKISDALSITGGLRFDIDQFFGNQLSPRIALVRAKPQGLHYKVLFGQGFLAPTTFQLFDEWRGNVQLVPEIIRTSEVEVGYSSPDFGLVKVNLFYNKLNNLIEELPNPDTSVVPIGQSGQKSTYFQNLGNMDLLGLSIDGKIYIGDHLNFRANYHFISDGNGGAVDNVAQHKINFGINYLLKKKINFNLRANWVGKTKAPITNKYYHPKTPESILVEGYDYVTEENPDGFADSFFLLNATITGRKLVSRKNWSLTPQLIIRNVLGTDYVQLGRQSGAGTRPIDALQTSVRNPNGFVPAYHPQPGREIFVSLKFELF